MVEGLGSRVSGSVIYSICNENWRELLQWLWLRAQMRIDSQMTNIYVVDCKEISGRSSRKGKGLGFRGLGFRFNFGDS